MIGRDKVLYKIGAKIIMEGMDMCKTLVETTAEIEAGAILKEVIVVIGFRRSRERSLSPRRYSNRQYGSSRLGSRSKVDLIQEFCTEDK